MSAVAAAPDARRLDRDLLGRGALFCGALLVFWITLDPLKDLSESSMLATSESSDLVNQLVFIGLLGLSVASLSRIGWRAIMPLVHPAYAAVLGWFAFASLFALNPGLSLRRLALTVIVMTIVGILLLLPRNGRQFGTWAGGVALAVVALCYLAVAFLPYLAVHQADATIEANLAGSWRGLYDHKSRTGPMMAVFMFIGAYLIGERRLALGLPLLLSAGIFLLFTGAKQPQALVPFAFAAAWVAGRTRRTGLLVGLCIVPLAVYLVFTVGSAIWPAVAEIDAALLADPTFTNRTAIWHFALERFGERPLFGFGFLGFWNTDAVRNAAPTGPDSWTANASHAHDSYLDLALTTGIPGLLLASWALVILPILDYAAARRDPANRGLALLFFRIWVFTVFTGSMETLFFQRDDAVWVAFLLAIFGLRYMTVYRTEGAPSRGPAAA